MKKEENRTKKKRKKERMDFIVNMPMNSSIREISRPLIISTWCNIKKKFLEKKHEKNYDTKNFVYSIFF